MTLPNFYSRCARLKVDSQKFFKFYIQTEMPRHRSDTRFHITLHFLYTLTDLQRNIRIRIMGTTYNCVLSWNDQTISRLQLDNCQKQLNHSTWYVATYEIFKLLGTYFGEIWHTFAVFVLSNNVHECKSVSMPADDQMKWTHALCYHNRNWENTASQSWEPKSIMIKYSPIDTPHISISPSKFITFPLSFGNHQKMNDDDIKYVEVYCK